MDERISLPSHLRGLDVSQVEAAKRQYGKNAITNAQPNSWKTILLDLAKEPMLIILVIISGIYFFLGELGEAYFMLAAICIVGGISFYQDNRSRKALQAIQTLTAPASTVIRNGNVVVIPSEDIVPGDLVKVEEGNLINADGIVRYSHDFSVNESTFTGEAHAVIKSLATPDAKLRSGTLVSTGMAVFEVTATGNNTELGQLGASLAAIKEVRSPLQQQIETFVTRMSLAGVIVFLVICVVSFFRSQHFLDSLLKGLTLAMSILPEELPVAFTTFLALGSRRLIGQGILVKRTRTVETLGSATVICTDKTGTITANKMEPEGVYVWKNRTFEKLNDHFSPAAIEVIEAAMWASEPMPFDPMEKAIHQLYQASTSTDKREDYQMVNEYPLGGAPPMMTHVFGNDQGHRIVSAKGAPEAFLPIAGLREEEQQSLQQVIQELASSGLRLLGVGIVEQVPAQYPASQQDFQFSFLGLIAFVDPPKENIREVIDKFSKAGIAVKIITGDNITTTTAIAKQAGLPKADHATTGAAIVAASPSERSSLIAENVLFTRMQPEAKLITVRGLMQQGEVVAMIGDGVNDAPALKAADIGVAMGFRGTEVARQAADMILLNDDLQGLVVAIEHGRRIYANLKKAFQYIIAIHIPILLTVSLPLLLGWIYPTIFTPLHVIFLELIMGPTCSIVFENEKAERNIMVMPPHPKSYSFLTWREMSRSVLQGLAITAGVLTAYQYGVQIGASEPLTRTLSFSTLVLANVFLTLVNRSNYYSFIQSARSSNVLLVGVLLVSVIMLTIMVFVPAVAAFFQLVPVSGLQMLLCGGLAFLSVFWIEVFKFYSRMKGEAGSEKRIEL